MRNKLFNQILYVSISAIILVSGVFVLTSCKANKPVQLPSSEIKEYNGKPLSPISDVQDLSIKGPQKVDIKNYKLDVFGLVKKPTKLTYDEVLLNKKYTKEVILNCVTGWSADILWEGILLEDIFKKAEVKPEANTVIFYSVDGYTTSLPLETIMNRKIMIAYKMNGVILSAKNGYPFILVAEDKLGYKWIKWINRIELSADNNYKGYWESRGYSNEANVNGR